MQAFRPIVFLFALFVMSACAYSPDNSIFSGGRCARTDMQALEGVDWDLATRLNLRIRQDDFLPSYMGLLQNHAYVLAIENADDSGHSFRAMEFFRAVDVASVRAGGGEFQKVLCIKGVSIPAGEVTEIRLVAVRDGSYEFDDNALMMSLAMIGSAGGFITIEPPKVLTQSPLEHLQLFIRKPIDPARPETKPTGLFDDQEEAPAPEPGGLFDDQEAPPAEPSTGLFDDPAPEQPVESSPSVPVETVPADQPTEGMFDEPFLDPDPTAPEPPVVEAPAPSDPTESMFDDPSLDTLPAPEPSLVDTPLPSEPTEPAEPIQSSEPAESIFDEPTLDSLPELETSEPFVIEAPSDTAPTSPDPLATEADIMMEEAPVDEATPEIPALNDAEEIFFEEAPPTLTLSDTPDEPASAQPAPQTQPQTPVDTKPLTGPPADIFSDPPDVVNSGPDSDGAAGEDQFDGSG